MHVHAGLSSAGPQSRADCAVPGPDLPNHAQHQSDCELRALLRVDPFDVGHQHTPASRLLQVDVVGT